MNHPVLSSGGYFSDEEKARINAEAEKFRESCKPTLYIRITRPRYEVQWKEWCEGRYAHGYGTMSRFFWRRKSAERFIVRYNRRQERGILRKAP